MRELIKETGKVIAVFGVLGVGVGLAAFVMLSSMNLGGSQTGAQSFGAQFAVAMVSLFAVGVLYFLGPVMGVMSGLFSSRYSEDRRRNTISAGLGSFLGFYLMFLIGIIILSFGLPSVGGGGGETTGGVSVTQNLVQMILVGIPTGAVGAVSGYLSTD